MEESIPRYSQGTPRISTLTSVNEHFPSVSDNENDDSAFETDRTVKKKRSRRQSRSNVLLGALKKELREVDANPAIRKHRKSKASLSSPVEDTKLNIEKFNETVSMLSWPRSRRKRRLGSLGALTSRSRRRSSVSSVSSGDVLLTDQELRKINLLQTLQNMGMKLPKRSTVIPSKVFNEIDIMENIQLRKRNSLSTRILEATKLIETKRSQVVNQPLNNVIREVTEVSDLFASSSDEKKIEPSRQSSATSSEGHRSATMSLSRGNFKAKHRASIAGTSYAMDGVGAFKRKLRRRKVRHRLTFKRLAKFVVILLRSWRAHAQSVHEILLSFDNLDAVTNTTSDEVELMFDITDYKAAKEAHISKELKRILCKKPSDRTEEEIYYIQIALRNYQSLVEYPVHMQKMLAERAWYESYDAKRIIVREGHVPMCFYFILTGSGLVSAMDSRSNQRKTLLYLSRGDSFGEQAIMTRSLRQTTVISRQKIELLTISDTDFVDIFMSGGLRDPNDPFLRSLNFLSEWPVKLLADNPKKAIFSYFKRRTVLVADSKKNEWIFIVKSGSCDILKKLESGASKRIVTKKKKHRSWRENVVQAVDQDKSLSHSDQLAILCEEEIKRLEEQNTNIHYYALPEINVATNAAYAQLREEHERIITKDTISRALNDLKNLNIGDDQITEITGGSKDDKPPLNAKRKLSIHDLGHLMLKTPYLSKAQHHPDLSDHKDGSTTVYPVTESDGQTRQSEESESQEERPSTANTRKELPSDDEVEEPPVYINVRTLTKGEVFGLQDIVFDNQTSLSLVSNGVEVIMINKKFFSEQLNTSQFVRLREKIFPYPTEQNLKDELTTQVSWDYHKKVTFLNALRNTAIRKQNIHDARSHMQIPPLAV